MTSAPQRDRAITLVSGEVVASSEAALLNSGIAPFEQSTNRDENGARVDGVAWTASDRGGDLDEREFCGNIFDGGTYCQQWWLDQQWK